VCVCVWWLGQTQLDRIRSNSIKEGAGPRPATGFDMTGGISGGPQAHLPTHFPAPTPALAQPSWLSNRIESQVYTTDVAPPTPRHVGSVPAAHHMVPSQQRPVGRKRGPAPAPSPQTRNTQDTREAEVHTWSGPRSRRRPRGACRGPGRRAAWLLALRLKLEASVLFRIVSGHGGTHGGETRSIGWLWEWPSGQRRRLWRPN
jgi:hypothetical protein